MSDLSSQNPISIVIEGALEPEQLLDALNEGSGGFVRRYVQQHGLLDHLTDKSLRLLVEAAVSVTTQLRMFVSAWIDTGLASDGEERPLARRLKSAQAVDQAVREFNRDYPIIARLDNLGDPEQVMVCDLGCYSLLQGERRLPGAPQKAAAVWAHSLFLALLLSPWKHRVCLCRRCGKFLMLPRAPRKSGYVRGVNCESCSSSASAVAITSRNRKDETEVLKMFAVKHCVALRCNCNPEIIKQRAGLIAQKVTEGLGKYQGTFYEEKRIGKRVCSRKWVVTHASDLANEQQRFEEERSALRKHKKETVT